MNFHNIKVDRSTIASINTGSIQKLDIIMTTIREQGAKDIADALQALTQAVMDSQELQQSDKSEAIEHLTFLAEQATTPTEGRNVSVIRTVMERLTGIVTTAAALSTLWTNLSPALHTALGI